MTEQSIHESMPDTEVKQAINSIGDIVDGLDGLTLTTANLSAEDSDAIKQGLTEIQKLLQIAFPALKQVRRREFALTPKS